jgi:DnaK suppressor protein
MARQDALLRLHKALVTRRTELRRKLSEGLDLGGFGGDSRGDEADVAFESGSDEMNSQLAVLESRELAQIERALRRLKEGTYGKCECCSGKIPVGRLNILPYTTVCVKCQRELEQSGDWEPEESGSWERLYDSSSTMEDPRVDLSQLELESGR